MIFNQLNNSVKVFFNKEIKLNYILAKEIYLEQNNIYLITVTNILRAQFRGGDTIKFEFHSPKNQLT